MTFDLKSGDRQEMQNSAISLTRVLKILRKGYTQLNLRIISAFFGPICRYIRPRNFHCQYVLLVSRTTPPNPRENGVW